MKKIILITTLFFIGIFSNLFAQTNAQLVQEEEKKIELYIQKNLKTPLMKKDLMNFIEGFDQEINAHSHGHKHEHGHEHGLSFDELSKEEQEIFIEMYRRGDLRQSYFNENPQASEIYLSQSAPLCANGDFESGNFMNYDGFSASGGGGYFSGECSAIPTNGSGSFGWSMESMIAPDAKNFAIVQPGPDPILSNHGGGFLNQVHSGNYAARINSPKTDLLNNCNPNRGINRLIKPIILQEDGVQQISFYYALVSEFPNHPNRNPVFVARALDPNGSEQDRICVVSNPANNPFFNQFTPTPKLCGFNPADVLWQNWTCETLEISGSKGEELLLEFIVTDCGAGAHFGYAYVDDICEPCDGTGGNSMGNIDLDDLDPCQELPFDVCGEFSLPLLDGIQGTLNSITLDILQNGSVVGTLTNLTLNGNTFCFEVNSSDFPTPDGGYDFRANAIFGINGGITTKDDTHTTPGQNNDFIFDNPDCCEIEAIVSDIKCDDQGTPDPSDDTWTFDLTVTNSSVFGSTWAASDPVNITGVYGATTNISMGNIADYGTTFEFKVYDSEESECYIVVTVEVPDPCSIECTLEAITSISSCSDNGTPLDPSDDYYNVTIEVINTQGQAWMILSSNMSVIYFGVGDENNINLGNYLVADQAEWFWVKLSDDPECYVDVIILAPESCNFDCNIEALVTVGECNDNGTPDDPSDDYYFITVNVVGTNGLPWHLIGHPNWQSISASGTGNTTNITLGPISTNDTSWPLYIFSTDPLHQDCRSETLVHAPKCEDRKDIKDTKRTSKKDMTLEVFISPNPNNGEMSIRGELGNSSNVILNVYKVDGTLMKTVSNLEIKEGVFSMKYQSDLPSGIYFFNFILDEEIITKRVFVK